MAAGSKLKNATADERRTIVARLYLRGWRQADIAKKFRVSQQTISQDLATAREDWRREAAESFAEWLAQELAKLSEAERELWRQWRTEKDAACMGLILRLIELRGRLTGAIKRDGSTVNVDQRRVVLMLPDNGRDGGTVAMREASPGEVVQYALEHEPGYIAYLQDKVAAEYEATAGAVPQQFAAVVISDGKAVD